MTDIEPLMTQELRCCYRSDDFDFETTEEIDELLDIIGQQRAVEAIHFGIGIRQDGYNLYALGPTGVGKQDVVQQSLERAAEQGPAPRDWCYVHNFEHPNEPRILALPCGQGQPLADDMARLIEDLQAAIPAAFESDDYQTRQQAIDEEFQERQEETFEAVHRKAEDRNITILRTPAGIALAPVRDGEVVPPGEFEELPEEEREEVEEAIQELQEEMQESLQRVPKWERERRDRLRELNRQVITYAIEGPIEELRERYSDIDVVVEHIDDVREDIIDNVQTFLGSAQKQGGLPGLSAGGGPGAGPAAMLDGSAGGGLPGANPGPSSPMSPSSGNMSMGPFRRYRVNVLVDNAETEGAPVVYEDQPSLDNLSGRVEHIAQFGALLTDFNLIHPGALHRANGGYLILDARKVLMQPFAWEQLKRVVKSGEIAIESRSQMMGLANTMSLEPEKVPLDVKVVLLGGRRLYYMLSELDPEFLELFKVAVDFEHDMERNGDTAARYACYLAKLIEDDELRPFSSCAVARVCDRSSREAGDGEKFSTHAETMRDLLRESHYWAGERDSGIVESDDVQRAIEARVRRNSRIRDRMMEQIERNIVLIDTTGEEVGQINALSVLQLGQFAFGRPSRITSRVRLGKGEVVDIEREVDLGGPIHSKGVLILSGYLGARFATDFPLSLSASLVFEQSYGGIDGDSASLAELCVLKSSLAQVPIAQSVALTGSINQHGRVQPIGGVNEKIEGFFDTCKQRGLSGGQGVIIPASNVKHLMLRTDVVDAVDAGEFCIWAVSHVDEATAILTGLVAGDADDEGHFPADSLNGRVQARLRQMAEQAVEFSRHHDNGRDGMSDQ